MAAMFTGNPYVNRELGRTWNLANDVRGAAVFSECGNFRPFLSRRWEAGNFVMWLCMNPSSATDVLDDATSRKLTRHSRRLGYAGLFLLNVMDYRATDPDQLPVGGERSQMNDCYIGWCAQRSADIVLAYGGLRGRAEWLAFAADAIQVCGNHAFRCVDRNLDETPRHPRRFPAQFALMDWH